MLCNRPTCTETGAALALPGTLQERDTPAPPRAGVVTLPLPIRLRSCAGRAAGPTPAAEPQPGSHREPGARESQYPDILAMFVAGTIIDCRNATPSPPCGTYPGSPDPREAGRHRTFPTPGDHRVSAATAALAGSHLQPPGASIPPSCACLRPGLSSGAFRLLTAAPAASTDTSSASGHVPLRAGRYAIQIDVSVDGFPEQGRQVA